MNPYYEDEWVTLYHGDCREVDAWLEADVLVTDPPYGMALTSGWNGHQGDLAIANDHSTAIRTAALMLWDEDAGGPSLVFGRWSVEHPTGTRAVLTWEKGEHYGLPRDLGA